MSEIVSLACIYFFNFWQIVKLLSYTKENPFDLGLCRLCLRFGGLVWWQNFREMQQSKKLIVHNVGLIQAT